MADAHVQFRSLSAEALAGVLQDAPRRGTSEGDAGEEGSKREAAARTLVQGKPIRSHATRGVLFAGFALISMGCDLLTGPAQVIDVQASLEEFVGLVNTHRGSAGCAALTWDQPTADVAQAHSEDMVLRAYFDHTNPDGLSPFDRLAAAGITYTLAGENIAAGYESASAVLQGWLDSPGHRANIENCGYTHHGLGLKDMHWTHVFITPN